MADWVDYGEVKRKVSLRDVLVHYKLLDGLKPKGDDKLAGPCPIHKGDNVTAFQVDFAKNAWRCFTGCDKGGNQIDLVAAIEGCGFREAAIKLKRDFLGAETPPAKAGAASRKPAKSGEKPPTGYEKKNQEAVNPPLNFTLQLKSDHPYLLKERGLKPETIEHFGLGWCARGSMAGRVAVPIHNERGELVAYAGRALKEGEEPRYKFPSGFEKAHVLYNLHSALPAVEERGFLVLVEGFFGAFRLHEAGFPNVAALMGRSLSEPDPKHPEHPPYQEELLLQALGPQGRLVLLFDGDDAGRDCTRKVASRLVDKLFLKIARLPVNGKKQPDLLSDEEIRALLG